MTSRSRKMIIDLAAWLIGLGILGVIAGALFVVVKALIAVVWAD